MRFWVKLEPLAYAGWGEKASASLLGSWEGEMPVISPVASELGLVAASSAVTPYTFDLIATFLLAKA